MRLSDISIWRKAVRRGPLDRLTLLSLRGDQVGFFGGMMHPGRIRAREESEVILLTRLAYDDLAAKAPGAAASFRTYLAKKRFIATSMPRRDGPKLML